VFDFAGNELVVSGDELESLGGSSMTTFINDGATEDTDPPFYHVHPEYGPSISIDNPDEVTIENSIATFGMEFQAAAWVSSDDAGWEYLESIGLQESALWDTGSGIQKVGIRMLSPSGEIKEAFVQTGGDFDFIISGNWSEYMVEPWSECGGMWGECMWGTFGLVIPVSDLELGTYESLTGITNPKVPHIHSPHIPPHSDHGSTIYSLQLPEIIKSKSPPV
jgi:hypothetical protein